MNAYAEPTIEQQKSLSGHTSRTASNRGSQGDTVLQRLQDTASNSVQVKQLQSYQTMADKATVQRQVNSTGMPDNLKSGIENLSGYAMDDVKVHYNSAKPAQLNAHAYAQGTDIHLAPGQEKHLPHEAWHVVQQKQGRVRPTVQLKGKVAINDDEELEHEADVMGEKALQMKSYAAGTQLKKGGTTPVNRPIQRVLLMNPNRLREVPQFMYPLLKAYDSSMFEYDLSGDRLDSFMGFVNVVAKFWSFDIVSPHFVYSMYQEHLKLGVQTQTMFEETFADAGKDDHGYDMKSDPAEFDGSGAVIQQARKPGPSGPKDYPGYTKMLFMKTTPDATIDFNAGLGNSSSKTNNKPGSLIDMKDALTQGGKVVNTIMDPHKGKTVRMPRAGSNFDKSDRDQHFAIADMLYYIKHGSKPNRAGTWTWHHLSAKYQMVLVNMLVHAKHGHNGGVHIW